MASILALLAACGSAGLGPAGGAASPGSASGSRPIGTLTRAGGLQGKTETLVVGSDGTLQLLQGDASGQVVKTARAPQAQLDSLTATFASRDWQQLAPEYGRQVPDGYAYTISDGAKQVVTFDGAQHPPVLDTLLSQLNALWQVLLTTP